MQISMLGGWFDKVVDFIVGFFAFIPQLMYFLYTSIASLLDVLQYLVRKLAGLDTYWVNGKEVGGDMITDFLRGIVGIDKSPAYSALSTVFWSLVIFGVILLVLSTIIAIIKAHYNYDANKSSPIKILGTSVKSLATMAIVPVVAIFGVYLAQILLKAVDSITSPSSAAVLNDTFSSKTIKQEDGTEIIVSSIDKFASGEDKQGYATYNSYDYFGAGDYTTTSTFSGMMFKVAAYNCNRVRTNQYRVLYQEGHGNTWDNMGVFWVSSDESNQKEKLANQIDVAFANNLKLKDPYSKVRIEKMDDAGSLWSSLRWGYSATLSAGLYNVKSFSKFNIGLVWYYYNLWGFNWILGFAGIIICASLLGSIVFGLMTRLLQVVALFIIFPALIGIMPLDEGSAFSNWRKQFTSDILMAFGAIVGMNIFFLILPFFNSITFFNPKDQAFLNLILNMIISLAGLTLIKKFIGMVSKFVGGTDANETGAAVMKDVQSAAMKGLNGTMKAATPALALAKPVVSGMKVGAKAVGKSAGRFGSWAGRKISESQDERAQKQGYSSYAEMQATKSDIKKNKKDAKAAAKIFNIDPEDVGFAELEAYSRLQSLDNKERKAILKKHSDKMNDPKLKYYSGPGRAKAQAIINNGLMNELAVDGTASGKERWDEHLQNVQARSDAKTVKTQKRYQRAQNFKQGAHKVADGAAQLLGVDTSKGILKGVGQAVVDFGGALGKSVADMTGASGAWKKLGDAGVVDAAKANLKRAAEAVGFPDTSGKVFTTKKAKEDREKDELKAMRQDQLNRQKEIEKNTKKTTEAIEDLTKKLEAFMRNNGNNHP